MTNHSFSNILDYVLPSGYSYKKITRTSKTDLFVRIFKDNVYQFQLEAHGNYLGLSTGIKYNIESDYSLDELKFDLQEIAEKKEHNSKKLKLVMKQPEIKKGKYHSYIKNDSGGYELLDDDYFD